MSANIETNEKHQGDGIDTEKNVPHNDAVFEVNNDQKQDSDGESEDFQEGVRRVRAITSVWTKQTMITMFVL